MTPITSAPDSPPTAQDVTRLQHGNQPTGITVYQTSHSRARTPLSPATVAMCQDSLGRRRLASPVMNRTTQVRTTRTMWRMDLRPNAPSATAHPHGCQPRWITTSRASHSQARTQRSRAIVVIRRATRGLHPLALLAMRVITLERPIPTMLWRDSPQSARSATQPQAGNRRVLITMSPVFR